MRKRLLARPPKRCLSCRIDDSTYSNRFCPPGFVASRKNWAKCRLAAMLSRGIGSYILLLLALEGCIAQGLQASSSRVVPRQLQTAHYCRPPTFRFQGVGTVWDFIRGSSDHTFLATAITTAGDRGCA
ncbi:hypothetical protein HaLaN_15825 [Haematococcus lacustris]|uniref:Uncharacterized protein n=1 Tax=Haematococcus lacustris TaxID=44745 RepID=A0A699ZIN1_HAELA|nr:hypothetical protein HaLaN_15825 [Haematococcus lacustris]